MYNFFISIIQDICIPKIEVIEDFKFLIHVRFVIFFFNWTNNFLYFINSKIKYLQLVCLYNIKSLLLIIIYNTFFTKKMIKLIFLKFIIKDFIYMINLWLDNKGFNQVFIDIMISTTWKRKKNNGLSYTWKI